MKRISFRKLSQDEFFKANIFYKLTDYKGLASQSDDIFIAEKELVLGVMRIENHDSFQVLRGMNVHPDYLKQGFGKNLLNFTEPYLNKNKTYCISRLNL